MKQLARNVLICGLLLALAGPALAGERIDLRLNDGSRWRGEVADHVELKIRERGVDVELRGRIIDAGDLWIKFESEHAGEIRQKTIFKADIIAIRSIHADEAKPTRRPSRSERREQSDESPGGGLGVFVLPMKGMVGTSFRHEEVEELAEHADQFGPRQIIVLLIDSHGGSIEMEKVHETIREIKKRHRVVAWIKTAISAAAASAIACDQIYFMTEGTLGAMTGVPPMSDKAEEIWLATAERWMETGGRSKYIARAMIRAECMLSYDKDPVTGKITWYDDVSGESVLSDAESNLVFTSSTAMRCGFADGVADTEDDLANVLNLPKWYEIDDYGRRIAKEWQETVERAEHDIPLLWNRLSYAGTGSGDPVVILGKRIQIYQQLIRWHDRCPNVAESSLPRKETLEREVKELRKQLADLKKRQRP